MISTSILDCSFRDGGYRTNWHFPKRRVESGLNLLDSLGVEFVELGFRLPNRKNSDGPFSVVSDRLVGGLNLPKAMNLGFMVEAKAASSFKSLGDYINWSLEETQLFNFVRIATTHEEFELAIDMSERFLNSGKKVFLNLMRASELSVNEIEAFGEALSPEINFYLADSYGSMKPDEVFQKMKMLSGKFNTGFHAHNNRGMALANSIAALDAGVSFIDGTLAGHGRGSGNTKIEEICLELIHYRERVYQNVFELGEHLVTHEYEMGQANSENSFAFHLGAHLGYHPNDVMKLMPPVSNLSLSETLLLLVRDSEGARMSRGEEHQLSTIRKLPSKARVSATESTTTIDVDGDICVLLGRGENLLADLDDLDFFLHSSDLKTVALNQVPEQIAKVDFLFALHSFRFDRILNRDAQKTNKIITSFPVPRFEKSSSLLEFSVLLSPSLEFGFDDKSVQIPQPTVLAFALAVCGISGAREVVLAGFSDSAGKKAIEEQSQILKAFGAAFPGTKLSSINSQAYDLEPVSLW